MARNKRPDPLTPEVQQEIERRCLERHTTLYPTMPAEPHVLESKKREALNIARATFSTVVGSSFRLTGLIPVPVIHLKMPDGKEVKVPLARTFDKMTLFTLVRSIHKSPTIAEFNMIAKATNLYLDYLFPPEVEAAYRVLHDRVIAEIQSLLQNKEELRKTQEKINAARERDRQTALNRIRDSLQQNFPYLTEEDVLRTWREVSVGRVMGS